MSQLMKLLSSGLWVQRPVLPARNVIAAAKKQSNKRRKTPQNVPVEQRISFDDVDAPDGPNQIVLERWPSDVPMPSAPPPSSNPPSSSDDDDEPAYPVFAPKPSNVERVSAWSWGEDGASASPNTPPIPEWNPKTGFMRTASEVEASRNSSMDPFAASSSSSSSSSNTADLPPANQGQVLASCIGTSFWMTVIALVLRQYALVNAPSTLGTDPRLLLDLLQFPSGFENWQNLGLVVGTATLVTMARIQLMKVLPEFRTATERSNKQILTSLSWFDILLVCVLTGVSEELLFRGAIIPASFPDWRGVLISGFIFGLLHNSGGRNLTFAAWATAVGSLYGGLFVYSHNIWVPAATHSIANFASAALWKGRNEK